MDTLVTKQMATSEVDQPIKLTKRLMNQYRESLVTRRCEKQTINMYFCYLNRLYAFLQGDKELSDENLKRWIESLKHKGYSNRTINMHISSVNGLLRFCGHKKAPVSVVSAPQNADMSELTRDEYLQLLSHIKRCGSERDYLLTKTLATMDINVIDLSFLTVEACQKGVVEFPDHRQVVIPDNLKKNLFAYIERNGLTDGPVFVTKQGNPVDRSNINHAIERYGEEAGLDARKCNPKALHSLYLRTQEEIAQHLKSLHMQEYEKLLDQEEKKVG